MAKHKLGLETLDKLGRGEIAAAFAQAIKAAAADIVDRPGLKKEREVNLKLKLKPPESGDGDPDEVTISFELNAKIPTKKSGSYSCGLTRTNELFFGGDQNNPYQSTIALDGDDTEEV